VPELYLARIGKQLQTIIANNSADVNMPQQRNVQCVYANWSNDLLITASSFVIAESSESKIVEKENEKTVCICLGNSLNTANEELYVIKDNQKANCRPVLIPIPLANSEIGFLRWITTLSEDIFILKNREDFEPLQKFWRQERIYRQKVTGYHWYFDFFHKENKIHYEVFDKLGFHVGEADIDGVIISGTQDKRKAINNIL
jgi:hypothetical protein